MRTRVEHAPELLVLLVLGDVDGHGPGCGAEGATPSSSWGVALSVWTVGEGLPGKALQERMENEVVRCRRRR